jgi:integrase/recombinase XerC
MSDPRFDSPTTALVVYQDWLVRQPLAPNTRRVYRSWVSQYCAYLPTRPDRDEPLADIYARDCAVLDFKTYLKTVQHRKPTSVNLALAALDHFYRFLGLGRPDVRREPLPQQAPRGLEPDEQQRLVRFLKHEASTRDRAITLLLLYTALRVSECSALNLDDVAVSARKGIVIVRMGKGNSYREVPLNAAVRTALEAWLTDRGQRYNDQAETALFLSRQGHRLTPRAIDLRLRRIAHAAGLVFSAHTLRHTCLTNLVRNGNDLVLVAEIAGHRDLETTRRYSLPSARDRMAAMDQLQLED